MSSVGTMSQTIGRIDQIPDGKKGILVMGNSKVGEGFSAKMATEEAGRFGSSDKFENGAVAGTTPRVWFYLLRQLSAPADRLAAIVVMADSYHDNDDEEPEERRTDIAFLHPLLSLTDLTDFPWSFRSWPAQLEAIEAILFKGLFYKADLQDFARNPRQRIHDVRAWRQHGSEWIANYPGHDTSLDGLDLDPATGKLSVLPGHKAIAPENLIPYTQRLRRYGGRPPDSAAAAAYRREWFGRLATFAKQNGIKLFVFRIPRGPLHYLADIDNEPTGALADLARQGALELLPASLFDNLERPEFFFDELHMNAAGRQLFSVKLADAVLQRLSPAK